MKLLSLDIRCKNKFSPTLLTDQLYIWVPMTDFSDLVNLPEWLAKPREILKFMCFIVKDTDEQPDEEMDTVKCEWRDRDLPFLSGFTTHYR